MKIHMVVDAEECPYWDYSNHTCRHTCNSCRCMEEGNTLDGVREGGLRIGDDRYCTLFSKVDASILSNVKVMEIAHKKPNIEEVRNAFNVLKAQMEFDELFSKFIKGESQI